MAEERERTGSYEFIRYEQQGHVVWITLNRPEVLNAIHPPMSAELTDAWEQFRNDPEAWVGTLGIARVGW